MSPREFAAFERRLWEAMCAKLEQVLSSLDRRAFSDAEDQLSRLCHDCEGRGIDAATREALAMEHEARSSAPIGLVASTFSPPRGELRISDPEKKREANG